MDTSLRDCVRWWSVPTRGAAKRLSVGAETRDCQVTWKGQMDYTWSSVSWPERVREEQRGQGEGWLWEDGDVVGDGWCLAQETCGGEQSVVLWSLALGAGARREVDVSVCGALRVRD